MKIDTSSERTWIAFNDEEISSRFVFFGRHFWSSQNVMLPHIHTAYEFIYIVGGEGSVFSRGIEYKLSQGDILVIEPNTEHEGSAHPENPFELFFMGYDLSQRTMGADQVVSSVDQIFLRLYQTYTNKAHFPIIRDHHDIDQILFKVMDEINDRQPCREEIIKTYLSEIFILMIRNLAEFVDMNELSLNGRESVGKAKEFMRSRFHDCLSLRKISDHVCLSPSHFSRLFKKETTYAPIQYLINIRIENAKKLMIFSDLSLTEISSSVGFSSIHYFSHCFKKRERICPLDYRRNKKKMLFSDKSEIQRVNE